MSNVYFISDTHFSHANIIIYEPSRLNATLKWISEQGNHKFDDVDFDDIMVRYKSEEDFKEYILRSHNEMIIDKWNSVVKNDDIVWFLGDFAFKIPKEKMIELCHRLNGHKRIIVGNHDRNTVDFYRELGFEYVSSYPIVLKKFFILSHAPLDFVTENTPFFNIYGHVHSHSAYQTHTSNSQCVCVERQDFTPVRIREFDTYVEEEDTNPAKERNPKGGM